MGDSTGSVAKIKIKSIHSRCLQSQPSQRTVRLVSHGLPLVNLCQLLPITLLSPSCVYIQLLISLTFPGTEVRLTNPKLTWILPEDGCGGGGLFPATRNLPLITTTFPRQGEQPHCNSGQCPQHPQPTWSHRLGYVQLASDYLALSTPVEGNT